MHRLAPRVIPRFPSVRSLTKKGVVWVLGQGPTEPVTKYYKKVRQIGEPGAYGKCYVAVEKATGKEWAVKVIPKTQWHSRPEVLYSFRKEIEAMRHCDHPNIVKFHHAFETEEELFIIMELCTGGDLIDELVAKHKAKVPYTEKTCAELIRQVLLGLNYMHEHNVLHLDLKPDNLAYVSPTDRTLKIFDFGMACFWDPREKYFSHTAGTPSYAAPELVNKEFGVAADMWSVGVITFVLLFGFFPFNCDLNKVQDKNMQIKKNVLRGFKNEVRPGRGPWFPAECPVSPLAHDFIGSLLTSVEHRLTCKEALAHKWITGDAWTKALAPEVLRGLMQFDARTKLQQAALQMMTDLLSDSDRKALMESWMKMDEDGNGEVSIAEFTKAMKTCHGADFDKVYGHSPSETLTDDQIHELFQRTDANADGTISYSELVAVAVHLKLVGREERLRKAFLKFDTNHDGKISVAELQQVLKVDRQVAQMMLNDVRNRNSLRAAHTALTTFDDDSASPHENGNADDGQTVEEDSIDYEEFLDMWRDNVSRQLSAI